MTWQSEGTQKPTSARLYKWETNLRLTEATVFLVIFCYGNLAFTLTYIADTNICLL